MTMSAVSTNLCFRNLVSIVNKSSCIDGPVIKASLRESLVEVFADASNTKRSFVIRLSSFRIAW